MANVNGFPLLHCVVIALSVTSVLPRPLASPSHPSDPAHPVSDGLDSPPRAGRASFVTTYLVRDAESGLAAAVSSSDTCEQTYGFMPCTTSWIGNLFLTLVYGYLMFTAATYLSNGSEMLLEILGPGIVGGLFLPMLGALPDAILILVSGLSGSTETAQSQVSVGMGLLAGSTVMLLTVIWGSCVIIGKCNLQDTIALDKTDTNGFSLTGSGVSNDIWTSYSARIMVVSVIPFIIVQVPQVLDSTSGRHLAVLIALIFSLLLLIAYCFYQVFQPWIQARRLNYVEQKHVLFGFLRHVRKRTLGRLLTDNGEVNRDVLEKLFTMLDENKDGYLSPSELKALIVGMRLEELDLDEDKAVEKIVMELDTSNDCRLELGEFVDGISRWIRKAISSGSASGMKVHGTMKFLDDLHDKTRHEHALMKTGDEGDGIAKGMENRTTNLLKAIMLLVLGTVIAAIFADPLVDAVDEFSEATSIPTFFISFIALPLATNASEAVSAIIFASHKRQRTASLTFSELYGSATMNNLLCLAVFLALVYIRGLTWDFSSEVLVIVIVCVVMGVFASFRTTFPLWAAGIAFLLYPLSLALVYILDYICGWS